jgi:hypothetical protein
VIGKRAAEALLRSKGWISPLIEFPGSPYGEAGGEIVWLGRPPRTRHPRMVGISGPLQGPVRIDATDAEVWQPPDSLIGNADRFRGRLELLCRRAGELSPRGLGSLLARQGSKADDEELLIMLRLGRPRVAALAAAYASDSSDEIVAASSALLGFGTGLTPAGDDLVGGALFGARLVAVDACSIESLRAPILAAARTRTHRLSAALLDDLARGESYGLLHDLVVALASGRPEVEVNEALARLGAVGHSSGWDMFTGLVIGVLRELPCCEARQS